MNIKQGDAYNIRFTLEDDDGQDITPDVVQVVEVTLGKIRKLYPGDLIFEDDEWVLPLRQIDTMRLSGIHPLEARVKFTDETVHGTDLCAVKVNRTKSRRKL